jgi:hypothetical protein
MDHPVRKLCVLVAGILSELDSVLAERYAEGGRPSISPGGSGAAQATVRDQCRRRRVLFLPVEP